MAKLKIEQLAAGMVLAGDVNSRTGRLLMAAGTVLNSGFETVLRTWGVLEVNVVGDDGVGVHPAIEPESGISVQQRLLARSRILPLFALVDLKHPAVHELLRLAILRKVAHG